PPDILCVPLPEFSYRDPDSQNLAPIRSGFRRRAQSRMQEAACHPFPAGSWIRGSLLLTRNPFALEHCFDLLHAQPAQTGAWISRHMRGTVVIDRPFACGILRPSISFAPARDSRAPG